MIKSLTALKKRMGIDFKSSLLFLGLIMIGVLPIHAQRQFHFHDGQFKVLQFTDLHILPESPKSQETYDTMSDVIALEDPDLIVITGDIITGEPATKGWRDLINCMDQACKPYTITLGNHDREYLTGDSIYSLLQKSTYFVGAPGSTSLSGIGNNVITVNGRDHSPSAILYLLDSHDYLPPNTYGKYDWIHFDQIEWYRRTSKQLSLQCNKVLPALMFFHIPFPEYHDLITSQTYYGIQHEGASTPEVNSGLFSALLDSEDVMGVFVGHDHNNDFIGQKYGIALAYGRVTGADAYGDLMRGGRTIVLHEGARTFDTWITTPQGRDPAYYYPSGQNQKQIDTMTYHVPMPQKDLKQGIRYHYYEGKIKTLDELDQCQLVKSGVKSEITIVDSPLDDYFAYVFDGYIYIEEKGVYNFYTYSDDGSRLYIDNQLVVDNDGGHSARRRDGLIGLHKGFHHFRLEYFESYMGQELEIGFSSKKRIESPLPRHLLFH